MRFKCDDPRDGEVRIEKKFLLFPTKINDRIVWLEWVLVKKMYVDFLCVPPGWVIKEYQLIEKD